MTPAQRHRVAVLLVCGLSNLALADSAPENSPRAWLQRMARAVQTTDYEGTVIRVSDGRAEALKVVHTVADGVVREKLIAQEGNGLEIVRIGNEVQCILPERQSVLVEQWNDQSTLFSSLPGGRLDIGSDYDLRLVSEERIAGRRAVRLSIRPHDEFRYEHRIWLDHATGFPLQTQLVAADGAAVDEVKFADISLGPVLEASELGPSYSTDNFKWYSQPDRQVTRLDTDGWQNEGLPPGFREVSAQQELVPGTTDHVTHILYSDGMASVSVFIAEDDGTVVAERSTQGASNTYSVVRDGLRITAVGEVPAVTVERIALAMQPDG
jgi:sigma-E factor negative regulatory protein RseB